MDSDSADDSAASDVSESPLDDVLESEGVEVDVECTEYGKQKGGAPDISIDEITILVILFHGTVRITEIPPGGYTGVPIDVDKLKSIQNLAYLGLAPTGLSNIGTNYELEVYKEFTQCQTQCIIESKIFESGIFQDSIKASLKKIEKKADELVTENANRVSQPVKKRKHEVHAIGIFSRMCTYCFHFLKKSESLLLQLRNLFTNYKFTNTFTVCKSVGAASLSGGNGLNLLKGGTKRGRIPIPIPPLSMSHDMFVLMLNELRLKIKDFDSKRIPDLCAQQLSCIDTTKQPDLLGYCETLKQTLGNIEERCRSLHILKGFGFDTTKLPRFINKDLSYNPVVDGPAAKDGGKNMGVIKLQFSIDGSGKVKCNHTPYVAHDVMEAIKTYEPEKYGGVYWSNMEKCIEHCTQDDPHSKTTVVIDLTCSSLLGGSDAVIKQSEPGNGYITYTGGGKRIKKKSGSRKKTRRVKNKSRTTRYIRNRRNRLKNNKRTKKSRKTKTSRKH